MTGKVRVRVPAKVNLALCVGGVDQRGYHELATVFQAVSLFDDLVAEPAPPGVFTVGFQGEGAAFLPRDDGNLALRAARLLAARYEVAGAGVSIRLRKRIPVAGGMAGGSADAAAALVACDRLWATRATPEDLSVLGAELGSDVPFMLLGGTALGLGRGDRLAPVPAAGAYHWSLALSHAGLSTPAVFREFDAERLASSEPPRPATPVAAEPGDQPNSCGEGPGAESPRVPPDLLAALADGDVVTVGRELVNQLQPAALGLLPSLERTLDIGLAAGACGALVSGSGPTCAFLSETAEGANLVSSALGASSGVRAVRLARGPVPGARQVEGRT